MKYFKTYEAYKLGVNGVGSLRNSLAALKRQNINGRYADPEILAQGIRNEYEAITGEKYEDEVQMSMDNTIADIIGHYKMDGPDFMAAWDKVIKESVVNEKLARGLKPLLKLGSTITKKTGEDALLDLSDKFDSIDDEYAGTIASHLDMAIELMQDGYAGDATKKLKQFNKACKDVLSGKEVGSAFENVNEATYNSKNHIGDTSDGQGSNAEIYKKGKGYYVVVSGEVDYDFTAKNDKELLQKLKDNEFDSTDILEVNEANDQDRLTYFRKLGIAPNNQPQNAAYIKQVSKPGKFFVDWKDAFDLGAVALEFVKQVTSISEFDIIDLKTMKRTGKQLDVKKGQLGNLRTTYGVRLSESYKGNFAEFKYDMEMAVDNIGISPKAIKKVSKKGKGFEVRMSSYMSTEETWKKLGDSFGAKLISFKPGSINIGIYE